MICTSDYVNSSCFSGYLPFEVAFFRFLAFFLSVLFSRAFFRFLAFFRDGLLPVYSESRENGEQVAKCNSQLLI